MLEEAAHLVSAHYGVWDKQATQFVGSFETAGRQMIISYLPTALAIGFPIHFANSLPFLTGQSCPAQQTTAADRPSPRWYIRKPAPICRSSCMGYDHA